MKIEMDAKLIEAVPGLKLGINYYTKITVSESPQMLKGRLQLFQEQLFFDMEDKSLDQFPGIKEWRTIWKSLGADPNRYRHSTEALMRRIKKQNYINPYHTAVDLNNFFSLQHEIPIGIYDLNEIVGNLHVSLGTEDDGYDGLNGRFNSLKHILLLKDAYSPFGSPFVDSMRTAVTEETTEALQVFFLRPSMGTTEALELTTACSKMFTSISGGDARAFVLHEGQTSIIVDY
ncbi:B3/4 domain-containing protein [Sporosarcina limicola]|uniref:DNA/RNA-binding domain of Phe-tRNA-synthetase-like protein n=1 Tax=Sporosarcina limicola TaxID=34101 RepID=A0A927MJD8_9BACL|nr:phenylalanine--tRNA ligase beta subunit-related protein [Sporosarcina limicola]MBE1554946.1 DNA/RNA-binding domain of Phe-tRNA-synthetase-like protein [Sporosarcina limicola]